MAKNGTVEGHAIRRDGILKPMLFAGEGAYERASKWAFEHCDQVNFTLGYPIIRAPREDVQ